MFGRRIWASSLKKIQDALENGSGATLIRGLPADKYSVEQLKKIHLVISSHYRDSLFLKAQMANGSLVYGTRGLPNRILEPAGLTPKRSSVSTPIDAT